VKSNKKIADNGHPGARLRDQILPALNISVSQAARDLHVTRQTLHRILAGRAAVSADMATRLEKLCGISAKVWLEWQLAYELQRISAENREVLARIPTRSLPDGVAKLIGG
jgi:addiction module HigA family antidote